MRFLSMRFPFIFQKCSKIWLRSRKDDLQSVEKCSLAGAVEAEDEDAHLLRAEEVAEVAHEPAHPDADPPLLPPPSPQMSNGPCNLFGFGLMMWAMLTSKDAQPGRQVAESGGPARDEPIARREKYSA